MACEKLNIISSPCHTFVTDSNTESEPQCKLKIHFNVTVKGATTNFLVEVYVIQNPLSGVRVVSTQSS